MGLGLALWSLGLIWPDFNLALLLAIVVISMLSLSLTSLLLAWRHAPLQTQPRSTSRPSRPVSIEPHL
jgi:hypothetical protein